MGTRVSVEQWSDFFVRVLVLINYHTFYLKNKLFFWISLISGNRFLHKLFWLTALTKYLQLSILKQFFPPSLQKNSFMSVIGFQQLVSLESYSMLYITESKIEYCDFCFSYWYQKCSLENYEDNRSVESF